MHYIRQWDYFTSCQCQYLFFSWQIICNACLGSNGNACSTQRLNHWIFVCNIKNDGDDEEARVMELIENANAFAEYLLLGYNMITGSLPTELFSLYNLSKWYSLFTL